MFGTVDTWIIYNLTGEFVTDVTNASRTMLLDLKNQDWHPKICEFFGIPISSLARVVSSSEHYGSVTKFDTLLNGIPFTGCLGDQQAAMVGQLCSKGIVKVTYGTGCFILTPTDKEPVFAQGLITTIGHKLGPDAPLVYAVEAAIPVAGSGISWFQKKILALDSPDQVSQLASQVHSNPDPSKGAHFLSTFGEMRFEGLTDATDRSSLSWAVLASFCFETVNVLEEIRRHSGVEISEIRVDGGITQSKIAMKIQADLLGMTVYRPEYTERTVFGAFVAAAIGAKIFNSYQSARESLNYKTNTISPNWTQEKRSFLYNRWKLHKEKFMQCLADFPTSSSTSSTSTTASESSSSSS